MPPCWAVRARSATPSRPRRRPKSTRRRQTPTPLFPCRRPRRTASSWTSLRRASRKRLLPAASSPQRLRLRPLPKPLPKPRPATTVCLHRSARRGASCREQQLHRSTVHFPAHTGAGRAGGLLAPSGGVHRSGCPVRFQQLRKIRPSYKKSPDQTGRDFFSCFMLERIIQRTPARRS